MGINELCEVIARVGERFAEEIAEQRLQEKTCLRRGFGRRVSRTGRGAEKELRKRRKKAGKRRNFTPISRNPGKGNRGQRQQEAP